MYTVIYADGSTRKIEYVACANFATAKQFAAAHKGAKIVSGDLACKGH